jgi:hypothetical protein
MHPNTKRKTSIFNYYLYLKLVANKHLWLKSHCLEQVVCDINCKWQRALDERKSQQIQVHPLTPLYMYCHMWLKCNYFGHNWGQMMCCHMF